MFMRTVVIGRNESADKLSLGSFLELFLDEEGPSSR